MNADLSAVMLTRYALPAVLVVFYLFCVALPAQRLRRRTGASAMVLHEAVNPFQRLIGTSMGLFVAALVLWVALFALLGPAPLGVWSAPAVVIWGGWAIELSSVLLIVMAQVQMGASWRVGIDHRPTALVTGGLFAVVRNPIFSGMMMMVVGLVFLTPSAWTVAGALIGALLMALQSRLEEQHLLRFRGQPYREYASSVGRFFPGIGLLPKEKQPWEATTSQGVEGQGDEGQRGEGQGVKGECCSQRRVHA